MQSTSIIRRWIRGSLLITVLVLVLAEGLFLSLIHISEPTRPLNSSRMPSSA